VANANLQPIKLSYQEGNYSSPSNFSTPEAATQTFYDGAPVFISAGYVQECGANPTRIDGVAIGAGHNDATQGTHNTLFTPADNLGILWEISIDKASSQGGASALLTQANVGSTYGITKDTIGSSAAGTPLYWYLDVDKSGSNQRVMLMGFPVTYPASTVNGRCIVKFLEAAVIQ
jgi:hypothetical protein